MSYRDSIWNGTIIGTSIGVMTALVGLSLFSIIFVVILTTAVAAVLLRKRR